MKVSTQLGHGAIYPPRSTAVALGFFDGVHLGHRAVIGAAVTRAAEGLMPCVFSFSLGTATAGNQSARATQLTPMPQKEQLVAALGVQHLFCPEFESFQGIPPEQFFNDVLVGEFGAGALCCGPDFHFGKNAAGDTALLAELCAKNGIQLVIVPPVLHAGEPISSTRIRAALLAGEPGEAAAMLGRPYALLAPVEHGRQLGRKLGYPTANQRFPKGQLAPRHGVYAAVCTVGGRRYAGATNVGHRPTVGGDEVLAETHIIGFSGQIYGEDMLLELHSYLRPEQQFESLDALQAAITDSVEAAGGICAEHL